MFRGGITVIDFHKQRGVDIKRFKRLFRRLSETSSSQIRDLLERLPQGAQHQLANHIAVIQKMLAGKSDISITIRDPRPGDMGYIAYRHGALYAQEHKLDQVFEKYVLQSLVSFLEKPSSGKIFITECCGTVVGFMKENNTWRNHLIEQRWDLNDLSSSGGFPATPY
jgi:hypothetical protein